MSSCSSYEVEEMKNDIEVVVWRVSLLYSLFGGTCAASSSLSESDLMQNYFHLNNFHSWFSFCCFHFTRRLGRYENNRHRQIDVDDDDDKRREIKMDIKATKRP